MHLSEAAITVTSGSVGLARVENTRTGVTARQVHTWCANPETVVAVEPVICLNEHIHTDAYEVPERLDEQTNLRDRRLRHAVARPSAAPSRLGPIESR